MPRRCGWMLVLCGAAFAGLSPVVLGGVDEWTTTGPRDGWPFAVADPLRAKHLFVGKSGSEALYASTDGGGTFIRRQRASDRQRWAGLVDRPHRIGFRLAVEPSGRRAVGDG